MAVLLTPLTALPLVLVVLSTTMLAHSLSMLLLAIKMSALVPSLLVLLQLQVDVKSMVQLALPPMPVACLKLVVLVLSTLQAQMVTSLLSALPSSLSFSLSDDEKKICLLFFLHFIVGVSSVVKIKDISNYLKNFVIQIRFIWEKDS